MADQRVSHTMEITSVQGSGERMGHWPSWVREASIRKPQLSNPHFLDLFLPKTAKGCFSNSRSVRVSRGPIQKAWNLESSFPRACTGRGAEAVLRGSCCRQGAEAREATAGPWRGRAGESRLACFKASGPPCRAAWKRWRGNRPVGPPHTHLVYFRRCETPSFLQRGDDFSRQHFWVLSWAF